MSDTHDCDSLSSVKKTFFVKRKHKAKAVSNKMSSTCENKKKTKQYLDLEREENTFSENLTDVEKEVLSIAIEHLETSFSLKRSNGYISYLKQIT